MLFKTTVQEIILVLGKAYLKQNNLEHSISDAIYYGNILLSDYKKNSLY